MCSEFFAAENKVWNSVSSSWQSGMFTNDSTTVGTWMPTFLRGFYAHWRIGLG